MALTVVLARCLFLRTKWGFPFGVEEFSLKFESYLEDEAKEKPKNNECGIVLYKEQKQTNNKRCKHRKKKYRSSSKFIW